MRKFEFVFIFAIVRFVIAPFDGGLNVNIVFKDTLDGPIKHVESYVISNAPGAISEFKNVVIPAEKKRVKDLDDYDVDSSTTVPKSVEGVGIAEGESL